MSDRPGNPISLTRLEAESGVFDFNRVSSFGRSYLNTYYCRPPTEGDFLEVLPRIGFDLAASTVESASIDGQSGEGINSVVLVAAKKLAGT
jgi:hypothetical protein